MIRARIYSGSFLFIVCLALDSYDSKHTCYLFITLYLDVGGVS